MPKPVKVRMLTLLRVLWFGACACMAVLWTHEIANLLRHPEEYAGLWGSELGWHYASQTMYLAQLAGLNVWFAAGMLLGLGPGRFRNAKLLAAHVLVSAGWMLLAVTGIA